MSTLFFIWKRRERDSNPRCLATKQFSRLPHSTTLPPLQDSLGLPTIANYSRGRGELNIMLDCQKNKLSFSK